MLKFMSLIGCVIVVFMSTTFVHAASEPAASATPLGLGIFPPVQFPPTKFEVRGIRLSALVGNNREVTGIDVGGIGNQTEQSFRGIALAGAFNWNKGRTNIYIAQLAGLFNYNKEEGSVYGIQASILGNQSAYMDIYGVQLGLYNRANAVYGLQVGLFNYTKNLHGIQIGLANYNEAGPFRISPLINFGF